MKNRDLSSEDTPALVKYFREISLAQDEAEIDCAIVRYNRLFAIRRKIAAELRSRPGDQRHHLIIFLNDNNLRVRLYAALETLTIAPTEARRILDQIHDWRLSPYSAEAASILHRLDDGSFVPT